ncbi:MATE family efflux transporter [Ruminococcaceae bacterium OttesenSCG-928-L11]|nr:MATE family efflux transporter [Ruminococcaceae bacterium OttesenSCG-928-L11]
MLNFAILICALRINYSSATITYKYQFFCNASIGIKTFCGGAANFTDRKVDKMRTGSGSQTRDMTVGSPVKLIVVFALPLMVGNVFQQLYTIVDAMVVGNALGVDALAAVGAADWPGWVVLGIVTGFTQGFSIPVSQYFGKEDYKSMRKAVCMMIESSIVLGVLLTVIGLLVAAPALRALNTPAEIFDDALIYLVITYIGILAVTAYNVLASILRALGNGRTPLIAMIIASVTNIVLDVVFVFFFGWGVGGAAFATVLAQMLSAIFCYFNIRKIEILHLTKEDFALDKEMLGRLFALGTPTAFQNAVIGFGGVVVQNVINSFGMVFIAGFTATNKLYGLLELAATSFGFSLVTYTGQNLGAGKYERIRSGVKWGLVLGIGVAAVISVCMLLFGEGIVGMFISDSPELKTQAVAVAFQYLKIMSYWLFILYMLYVYRSALYGLGDTVVPMISGIVELIMRVGIILILPRIMGQDGVYYAEVAAWAGAALILAIAYYVRMHRLTAG